jgi:hypothetical protein
MPKYFSPQSRQQLKWWKIRGGIPPQAPLPLYTVFRKSAYCGGKMVE